MAGSKVSNFAIGDSNIQSVMLTLDKTFKGQHQVSLTNYSTTAESQVAAGSVIEIGGALYKFDSNESITGSPSDGTVYIMAVPSGDSVTCAYTDTAPTWSDSKQGWYGTGATVNNRYLEFVIIKVSTNWSKIVFNSERKNSQNKTFISFATLGSGSITTTTKALLQSTTDILSEWNNSTSRFTPKRAGYYQISGSYFGLIASGGTGALGLAYTKDGSLFPGLSSIQGSHVNSFFSNIYLNTGDYLEFYYTASVSTSAAITTRDFTIEYKNF